MPGKEGEPPSPQQLVQLRERALSKIAELGSDGVLSEDVVKISQSDHYVKRFWLHVFDHPGEQMDEACNMIIETLKWRKSFEVDKISEDTLNAAFFDKGTVYSHNRDKDGKKLIVFHVGIHEKGKFKMDEMKRFFIYYLERMEREEKGELITIVFDCRNAGLKNMDMEFIQFIIGVFKDYYPEMLNYILVFEMPWVLNAAWKVIKAWLPAAAVKKIKFLTKSNMNEYIDESNRLECWGGSDPWEYTFEPEVRQPIPEVVSSSGAALVNGSQHEVFDESVRLSSSEEALRKKTVTFAEVRSSPSVDSFNSSYSSSSAPPDIIRLNPSQEVIFSSSPNGDLWAKVQLTNICERKVGFKIKTTSPEKYRVRPSSGILNPRQELVVELHLSGQQGNSASLLRDKFLVTVIYLDTASETSNAKLQELLKNMKPEGQYRLRCQLAGEAGGISTGGTGVSSATTAVHAMAGGAAGSQASHQDAASKDLNTLFKKINKLSEKMEDVESQLSHSSRIQYIFLVLTLFLLLLVWFYLPSAQTRCGLTDSSGTTDQLSSSDPSTEL